MLTRCRWVAHPLPVQMPGRRVVRHEPALGVPKDLFEMASRDVAPIAAAIGDALKQWKEQVQQWQEAQQQQPADGQATPAGQ